MKWYLKSEKQIILVPISVLNVLIDTGKLFLFGVQWKKKMLTIKALTAAILRSILKILAG